ncbi:MAG: heat-inducible transcriptional repressor HrcA, partial [Dehalococcoidia bacterium]
RKYDLAISPATVRNEMVQLEEEGYIIQPHTSAGRMPSDKGYRYYVEALMVEKGPPVGVQEAIRHQFQQAAQELEGWARLGASVLAQHVGNAAVVTVPHSPPARLRWLELVQVQELLALLIVVLQEARVRERTLPLSRPLGQDDLSVIARRLNGLFAGLTAIEIRQQGSELSQLEGEVARAVAEVLESEDEAVLGPAFLEGIRHMLRQPEFAESRQALDVLGILDEDNLPRAIPFSSIPDEGVTVVIGGEHPEDAMRQCSLVLTRYGSRGSQGGTMVVVGPTRLQYSRSVAMVRYVASLMDELMEVYFG